MPTVTRVLVKDKTGVSPADKKQRGDSQGCDQGTLRDLSNETEIRIRSNITPFVPSNRPSAVTGSSSFLSQQVTQNDGENVHDIMAPSGPVTDSRDARRNLTFDNNFYPCEGIAQKLEERMISVFIASAFKEEGIKLMEKAMESRTGMESNSSTSPLLLSPGDIAPPFQGLFCRLHQLGGQIIIVSESCSGQAVCSNTKLLLTERPTQGSARCNACRKDADRGRKQIKRIFHSATTETSSTQENVSVIARNPKKAEHEINKLRNKVSKLTALNSKLEKKEEQMMSNPKELIERVMRLIDDAIAKEKSNRRDAGVVTEKELWLIHTKHMLNVFLADGNMRQVNQVVELVLWAMAMHARTSNRVYKEIAKVMKLAHISTVYKKGNELVSTGSTRAFSLCTVTLSMLSQQADRRKLNDNQRLVFFAIDSANINAGLQWDYVRNQMVGGCEGIAYQQVRQMFYAMASRLQDNEEEGGADEMEHIGSIMDNMRLAKEHCVAKMTSVEPDAKGYISEVIASTDCEQFSGDVVMQMTHSMQQLVPNFNFLSAGVVYDAANPNWSAVKASATHSVGRFLPSELKNVYPAIDFDGHKQIMLDVMDKPFVFLSDPMHLLKNNHTTLEKSSSLNSKRDLWFRNCPMNLKMVQTVWHATGGGRNQMHPTKLSALTFNRDAKSRMDCTETCRLFSNSVARMFKDAIADTNISQLGTFKNKHVYKPLMYYIQHLNNLVDITNGKRGHYTPENGSEMQKALLGILDWFSKWKKNHDSLVAKGERTEYNFLATITWDCLRNLILGHVFMIQYYSIKRGYTIDPRTLSTDPVEHHFGNCRQMVGGSTSGLTSAQYTQADRKASLSKAVGFAAVGNCRGAEDHFKKAKKF